MTHYNLTGLNPKDFEHLTQALAKEVISSQVTPYGDGPDGGREATHEGVMDYGKPNNWNGYLVMQCKYRARPEGPSSDSKWAKKELENEFRGYGAGRKKKRRLPEYYIFVTNITLTSAQGGGKDAVRDYLQSQVASGLIKAYDVWSYDELCRFIDGNYDIRKAYAGFITPGDVLAEAIRLLNIQSPNFENVMLSYLQKELLNDFGTKLESAAKASSPISLSSVFIDLPMGINPNNNIYSTSEDTNNYVLKTLIGVGGCRLSTGSDSNVTDVENQSTGDVVENEFEWVIEKESGRCEKHTIIGGPGQGKSTVGQMLCLFYRAKFLNDFPASRLDSRVAEMVKQIMDAMNSVDLIPRVFRFPFRIVLNTYASDLARDSTLSIFEVIRLRIEKQSGGNLPPEVLRQWLSDYPCVIIFDGLDEVPASSNRLEVLDEINSFQISVSSWQGDFQYISTSRPQGYADEFKKSGFQHLFLLPLMPKQALEYGTKLVKARHPDDVDVREQILRRLKTACDNPSTARLMQSPLQVTILATLVERIGEPPRQRFKLFSDYYKTIYDREVSREGPLSEIMRDRETDINLIHYRTGFILQTEGEASGATESRLTEERFIQLVWHLLVKEREETKVKASQLISKLRDSTIDRLVFLVKPDAGFIAYELRSLQEYMAAEAIMNGDTEFVRSRLRTLAPTPYWRNVFLFCVGKAFSEANDSVIDSVLTLCHELNNESPYQLSRWGSQLALQVLLDGVADENRKRRKALLAIALNILDMPTAGLVKELAHTYTEDELQIFRTAIMDRIQRDSNAQRLKAYLLLITLADKNISWAKNVMNERWPSISESEQNELMLFGPNQNKGIWSKEYALTSVLSRVAPPWIWEGYSMREKTEREIMKPDSKTLLDRLLEYNDGIILGNGIKRVSASVSFSSLGSLVTPRAASSFKLGFVSVFDQDNYPSWLLKENISGVEWSFYIAAATLCTNPSAASFANALDVIVNALDARGLSDRSIPFGFSNYSRSNFPWLLGGILAECKTIENLISAKLKIISGHYGDEKIWADIENHLRDGSFFCRDIIKIDIFPELTKVYISSLNSMRLHPSARMLQSLIDHYNKNAECRPEVIALIVQSFCLGYYKYGRQNRSLLSLSGLARDTVLSNWEQQPAREYFDLSQMMFLFDRSNFDILADSLSRFSELRNFHCSYLVQSLICIVNCPVLQF